MAVITPAGDTRNRDDIYFPHLTFCRYIAACIVLLYHFALVDEVLTIPIIGNMLRYASSSISFFFVLTGFVLIISLSRAKQLPTALPLNLLLLHRAIRLYPLHWLALGLLLVGQQLIHLPSVQVPPIDTGKLLTQALLLHAWYPDQAFAFIYNYVSWTLCVELLLTLLAPWLYGWMVNTPTRLLMKQISLIWLGSLSIYQICLRAGMPLEWGFFWPPFHVPEFVLGMGGGFLISRHLELLKRRANWLHVLAYLNAGLMLGALGAGISFLYRNSLLFAPSYVIILLSVAVSKNWLTRIFSTGFMQYLGKISYGVYILQLPVSFLVLRWFHGWMGWPYRYSALLFGIALTGVAALTYEWIEKPLISYAKARLNRQVLKQSPVEASLSK